MSLPPPSPAPPPRPRWRPAHAAVRGVCRLFDAAERRWEAAATQRALGVGLVVAFLGAIVVVEARRRGLLPPGAAAVVPTSHFAAVGFAFSVLLVVEVIGLVFALARSVADAMGKQFELLSLILLRKAFLEVARFGEPIEWTQVTPAVLPIVADMVGALAVFVLTVVYYRLQRHTRITVDAADQARFVAVKQVIATGLLAAFAAIAVHEAGAALRGEPTAFFETFYTVLVFSDILIVLVSLAFTSEYRVVFRNSGFAAATVLVRLALTAPAYVNVLLAVGAALFIVALSWAYDVSGRAAAAGAG